MDLVVLHLIYINMFLKRHFRYILDRLQLVHINYEYT